MKNEIRTYWSIILKNTLLQQIEKLVEANAFKLKMPEKEVEIMASTDPW